MDLESFIVCVVSLKDAEFISGDLFGILKGTTEAGTAFEGSDDVLLTRGKYAGMV